MARKLSFALDAQSSTFVESKVAQGHYASASEVVQAGLRLLEERDVHLANLRRALIEGAASGEARHFDFEAFLAEKQAHDRSGP